MKLGRYQVQRKIEAASGDVYAASETGSGRAATLKLVRFTAETSPDQLAQSWRSLYEDVRAAAALQHPNIAQIFEVFEHEGKTWIATEAATDKNLASLLSEATPLPQKTIVEVLRQTGEALDYAHRRGIVHRTIRPSNIGVQANGAIRVFGFGLSRYYLDVPGASSAADLAYLTPELIRGESIDGRCDQFSLAAIAYEMLTGEAPFQGTEEQIRAGIVEQEPLPADGLNPAIGPEAARVLAKALSKRPDERFATCGEFVAGLERALQPAEGWSPGKPGPPRAEPGVGGKSSPELTLAKRSRAEDDHLIEDLVAQLSGGPEKAASGGGPSQQGGAGNKALVASANPKDAAAEKGEAAGQAPQAGKGWESVPWEKRKVLRVAAVAVALAAATLAWFYFGYGGGESGPGNAATGGPAFQSESLPPAAPGAAYREAVAVQGGSPPFHWNIEEGELPPGLTLDPATGVIQGTPHVAGSYPFKVAVSDEAGDRVAKSFTLNVQLSLAVRTSALPSGVVGQLYQYQLEASGGSDPYLWELASGKLPNGLLLNSDGLIVGRAQEAGAFRFEARVRDESKATAVHAFNLRVGSGLTLLSAAELPSSSVDSPYEQRLTAGGGSPPFYWSVSGGSLPAGLSLDRSSGLLHGRASSAGHYNLEVVVRDSARASAVQSFRLEVQSALAIVTAAQLADANVNRVYSKPLELAGGNWPYRWSLAGGTLPPGVHLDESSGTLRGTPELGGSYEFDVQVRDAFRAEARQRFRLEVTTLLEIQTAYDLPDAMGPGMYSQSLLAKGGEPPYLWSVTEGTFPKDFALDSTSGVLSGVPTARGDYRFTVEVSDGSGTKATRLLRLSVIPALRFNDRGALPHAIASESYSHALAVAGGKPPHAWKLSGGALPDGLKLDEATGVVEGAPQTPGKYRFAVEVADAAESSTRQFFELEVKPPAPGEMVWRGELPKDGILMIHDGRYASIGTLTGALPGVPVKIDLEPQDGLTVVTAPARSNNWKVLVINASQPQTKIIIRWTPLSSL